MGINSNAIRNLEKSVNFTLQGYYLKDPNLPLRFSIGMDEWTFSYKLTVFNRKFYCRNLITVMTIETLSKIKAKELIINMFKKNLQPKSNLSRLIYEGV